MEIYLNFKVTWHYPTSSTTNLSLFQLKNEDSVIIDIYIAVTTSELLYAMFIGPTVSLELEKNKEYHIFLTLESINFNYYLYTASYSLKYYA